LTALVLGASLAAPSPTPAGAGGPPPSATIVLVPYEGTTTAFVHDGATTTAPYIPVTDGIVEGNFSAVPGSDVLVFGQGGAPDGIVHVTPTDTGVTTSFRAETINSSYVPLVGDFDGNGIDDVFWYGAGNRPDSIWFFQPDGSHEIVNLNVWGHYRPFALDADGNGQDDVFWYAPGTAADSLWLFGVDANVTKRSVTVNGSYDPHVGQFQEVASDHPQDQIVWHDPSGPDSLWSFTPSAGHTSHSLPNIDGLASPIVGHFLSGFQDSIFWYTPGSTNEYVMNFDPETGPFMVSGPSVDGLYTPVVGDFNGNGFEDIAWTSGGRLDIWQLGNLGTVRTQTWISTPYDATVPAVARVPDEP
jgi:hypothetical protein